MSDKTDETEVNVMKTAKFNGKKKSWDAWSAKKKGHKEILTGGVEVTKDGDNKVEDDNEKKSKVKAERHIPIKCLSGEV